ncbi:putative signal transducing protein [Gilvimarinus agarilyticus]|uniref:putative signal transducing protein n=1 Tax=Gilvimarinus agarilyticus TaxID=679259 RepID=UPI000A0478E1|nr:DUF2007 domain-containing protein [Gilvimarinus agarilyticus]
MSDTLLYQAANTIEANMIVDVLGQAGIAARIQGEYLQGGIGELQALGVVRVMVAESDYGSARQVVDDWDKAEPVIDASIEQAAASSDRLESAEWAPIPKATASRVLWGVLIGAVLAIAVLLVSASV